MYYNIASRVIPPPLHKCYEDVADYAQAMYKGLNERAGLGLKAQRAKYNKDRVKGLVEYACGTDNYASRQKNFEGSLVNYSQSVATDTMKENAEFQFQAGLSPVIRRRGSSDCCSWCKALIGDYHYETVKATGSDVYRRHRACRCQVYYDPGDGKVQDVHTKRWEKKSEHRGETFRRESVDTRRRRGSRGQEIIDKATFNRLTKDFIKSGGIIRMDDDTAAHLQAIGASASYLPDFRTALFKPDPTISDVLEEMYHDLQHRKKMYYHLSIEEAELRREIDAQKHLLSLTKRYKIPVEQVEETRKNLKHYEEKLNAYLKAKRHK